MREIGIEHLRKDLASALEDLPFVITRRGVKVAIVEPYSSDLNLTFERYSLEKPGLNLTVDKPRLPSSRKRVLKAGVKAVERDEFNPLKARNEAKGRLDKYLDGKPFRAVTHHRG